MDEDGDEESLTNVRTLCPTHSHAEANLRKRGGFPVRGLLIKDIWRRRKKRITACLKGRMCHFLFCSVQLLLSILIKRVMEREAFNRAASQRQHHACSTVSEGACYMQTPSTVLATISHKAP
ncbi:hypothetical protein TRVL_08701 [Trypanosoma vivax]|nr:hypothetical protein TRVL_08701 [Trypanosoma vivax]